MKVGSQFGKKNYKLESDFEKLAKLEAFFEKLGSWNFKYRNLKGRRSMNSEIVMGKWEKEN